MNHDAPTEHVYRSACKVFGEENACMDADKSVLPLYTSEDFAYYTAEIPGTYMFLGTGMKSGLHESDF